MFFLVSCLPPSTRGGEEGERVRERVRSPPHIDILCCAQPLFSVGGIHPRARHDCVPSSPPPLPSALSPAQWRRASCGWTPHAVACTSSWLRPQRPPTSCTRHGRIPPTPAPLTQPSPPPPPPLLRRRRRRGLRPPRPRQPPRPPRAVGPKACTRSAASTHAAQPSCLSGAARCSRGSRLRTAGCARPRLSAATHVQQQRREEGGGVSRCGTWLCATEAGVLRSCWSLVRWWAATARCLRCGMCAAGFCGCGGVVGAGRRGRETRGEKEESLCLCRFCFIPT